MHGGCNDVRKAYRKIVNAHLHLMIVMVIDPSGCTKFFRIFGMCFGPAQAVLVYNVHEELLTTGSQLLLAVPKGHYFDDSTVNEPTFAGRSGQEADEQWYELCGLPFDIPRKQEKMSPRSTFQGVETDFRKLASTGRIALRVPQKRRLKLCSLVDQIRRERALSPAQASSFVQKARWVTTPAFGRLGRAALQPLIARQFREASHALTPELESALEFIAVLAQEQPDAFVDIDGGSHGPPVVVLTDASADSAATGMLGLVVYDPAAPRGRRFWASARKVPPWMLAWLHRLRSKETYIGQHELTAEITPYISLPTVFKGRRVVHFVDNESALSASISGYSPQQDSSRLINLFHLVRLQLRCNVWFYYVPSESNLSDWPSRGRLRDVLAAGARACFMRLPRLTDLTAPWASVYANLDSIFAD